MSNLRYEPKDYKKKLTKLLKLKKEETKTRKSKLRSTENSTDNPSLESFKRQPIKRKPTPYHPATSKAKLATNSFKGQVLFNSNESGSDCEDSNSTPSKNEKTVKFSELPKSDKKSVKRQSTPYHPVNKKIKRNNSKNHGLVLFPPQNSSIQYESTYDDTSSYVSVSSSELSKCNNKETPIKQKRTKKIKKDALSNCKDISERKVVMEAGEITCDNEDYQTILSNTSCPLEGEESNPEHSSDLEFNTACDYSNTIIDDDISFDKNGEDFEANETNVSEHLMFEDDKGNSGNTSQNLELGNDEDENRENTNEENSDTDIREEITADAEYFYVEDKWLIILHSNSKLYFKGLMSVRVLQGAVEVLGYTLTSSSGSVEIFSPRGSSLLYLETKEECVSSVFGQDLSKLIFKLGMVDEDISAFCQRLKPYSTVILCEKITANKISFLEKHISQQLFPQCESSKPQCKFQNKIGSEDVLKINVEWDSLVDSVNSTSKVFICGGKSVGKSTMLRYIMNKLLSKYSEVLVVDLDPGQPEFTVAGCISATIVNEPVFGPNYTHLRKPVRCLFVPNINVFYEPDGYLALVEELIFSCADLPNIPTVINYMGFTRGLGLEIFSAVVAYVQPTCMIEIQSSSGQRNFKSQLTHQVICSKAKLLAKKINFIPEFPIHTIQSMADTNQGWHLEPRQIREMCVLTYLSEMIPQDVLSLTDTRVPVFVIDLSLIKIVCNGQMVNPAVINANLVALCSSRDSSTLYTCHGWGVVRGINLSTNQLFLLTPVPPEELELVDHLILGSVSLPPSLYMTSDDNTGLVPFISQGVLVTLGKIPKRTHLPRFKPN